jgi:predicted DNA-binding transcriptional regulator AlpA
MRPKKNTVAKIGKHVVTFGGDGTGNIVDPLLTVRETAEILRCSVHSLNKWRLTGAGPRFVYVGSRVRYRRSDIEAFIDRSTRASTSDSGGAGPQAAD